MSIEEFWYISPEDEIIIREGINMIQNIFKDK